LGLGQRYHREGPATQPLRPRGPDSPSTTTSNSHSEAPGVLRQRRACGIDYQAPWAPANAWPFAESSKQLGGLSWANPAACPAFPTDELETLQKVYYAADTAGPPTCLLERAAAALATPPRTIPEIVFPLQQLR